jgi:hypothetical protein
MTNSLKSAVVFVVLTTSFWSTLVHAQKPQPAPTAPVPLQISVAKKIFIGNAGGDERSYEESRFSGGPDRAYNQFYAAMKSWAHYEIVTTPADADLLLEVRFTAPEVDRSGGNGLGEHRYDPQFRLEIRDPKTDALLWGFTEHAQWAVLQGNRDKNFDLALAKLASDLERVAQTPNSADSAKNP